MREFSAQQGKYRIIQDWNQEKIVGAEILE